MLNIALAYAARGWRVHPLKPRDKRPLSKNGCKDGTLDPDIIRRWWTKIPDANIGLATGYEFFVLDIDPDGMAWYEANDLPTTHEAVTGRAGRHLLYRIPAGIVIHNSTGKIASGVDVRGIGGYIVAAPSQTMICDQCGQTTDKHVKGCQCESWHLSSYTWLDCEGDVPSGPCVDAPLWLVDMAVKTGESDHAPVKMPAHIAKGVQHMTLFRFACSLWARGDMSQLEVEAAAIVMSKRCEEIPPEENVSKIARDVCAKYPAGKSAKFQQAPVPPAAPGEDPEPQSEEQAEDELEPRSKLVPNAVGDRIMQKHSILNVDGYLYEYTGIFWQLVTIDRLKSLAAMADGKFNTSQKRRGEIADYIRIQTHVKAQVWRDLEPYEIPVGNGVVDVRSMTLRRHRKSDMLQACCPVDFDPRAQCAELMRCLDTYFGNDDDGEAKMSAIQEFFGYCLMPHARYKKALLCVGESDCGKSTIPYLIRKLVGGQNTCSISVEDMDDSRARAPLLGKLVNLLTELTSDAMIADGGFKTLVSTEEPIQFDPKYLPPVMDVPICKHVIVTNTLPTINDRSRGTYNRLLIVRFNHVIPRSEQDRSIWDKLSNETPGILQWALEGAQRLYHAGGSFTSAGEVEVEEYRAQQDPLTGFLADECETGEDRRCSLPDLRARYQQWSGKPTDPRWFANLLRQHGFNVSPNPVYFGTTKKRAVEGISVR